jgi:hypothetical protein
MDLREMWYLGEFDLRKLEVEPVFLLALIASQVGN